MTWILNPRIFTVIMLALNALASVRWAFERNWPQSGYWFGALILNTAILFMGGRT